jgi:hypothetical protein
VIAVGRIATDTELEEFARFVARTTLEIERNLRGPEQLQGLMTPRTWELWQRSRLPGAFSGGMVTRADIGRPRIQRLDARRAIANVVTRTDAERWGALTLKLDATSGRWRATGIQRLYASRHYRTGPTPPLVEIPAEQRLANAQSDRHEAAAALRAVERRLDELPADSTARRQTKTLSTTWKRIVADLDREIATLEQRHELSQRVQRTRRRIR